MKKMFEYDWVRQLYFQDGLSRREIARKTGFHRKTINKMLLYAAPPGYRVTKPRRKVKLDPFIGVIDEMLEGDKEAPKKQRHTAKRVFQRLKDEHGFTGSYTIVKDYVREKKLRLKEVFLPLAQRPGTSQTDFGQAKAVLGGKQVTAHFFCMALPFSDAVFVKAYPTEAMEALQDGHNAAYAFFKGVPPTNLYDNTRTIVKGMFGKKERELTDGFLALRSHYVFSSLFCQVRKANEKGVVETLIGYVRRNFFVPVPGFPDWDALNSHLLEQCTKRLGVKPAGKNRTVGELLDEERKKFLQLPPAPFDACRLEERHATSQSLVHFQGSAYSVPVEYAYCKVTVKGYVDRVVVCDKDAVLAEHRRSYEKDDTVFDPVHYLPLLERKPGGLDGAMPFSSWELPACFEQARRYLEGRNGNGKLQGQVDTIHLSLLLDNCLEI
ncbi:MAG: IS21 family transposase [Planctomycetota bacterium]|nr:IS21 family transposase [Planctomycetota bacterium]